MKKSFTGTLEKFEGNLWGHHIPVPEKVYKAFVKAGAKSKRVVVTYNGTVKSQHAFMHDGDGGYFFNINKEIRKELKLRLGEEVKVEVEEDDSKYGIEICPEMTELLEQDEKGSVLFHQLTIGKQRSLIYQATKPKRSETRLHKAINILEYLKSTGGKLDFKDLNQYFKDHK